MKNRAQTKYVALWQRCETLERQVSGGGAPAAVNAQVDTTNPSASAADELKKVKDELTEIEEASIHLNPIHAPPRQSHLCCTAPCWLNASFVLARRNGRAEASPHPREGAIMGAGIPHV